MADRDNRTHRGIAIALQGVSHTFKSHPVFDPVSAELSVGSECLIRGANGSGKSTLGRIVAGELTPAAGNVRWSRGEDELDAESLCILSQRVSPVSSLHPQLSIAELMAFQGQFRPWVSPTAAGDLLEKAGLSHHMHKAYHDLSSGMKQRVKLTLALASQTGLIVLDEPCANLDVSGVAWYREAIQEIRGYTTLVVCSNDRKEDYIDPELIIEL